jgi:hypothetical protein
MDFLLNGVNPHPGEIFQGLNIHIFEVTDFRELGPEWDVQRQGHCQRSFNILMGHNAHGGGLTIGWEA